MAIRSGEERAASKKKKKKKKERASVSIVLHLPLRISQLIVALSQRLDRSASLRASITTIGA